MYLNTAINFDPYFNKWTVKDVLYSLVCDVINTTSHSKANLLPSHYDELFYNVINKTWNWREEETKIKF